MYAVEVVARLVNRPPSAVKCSASGSRTWDGPAGAVVGGVGPAAEGVDEPDRVAGAVVNRADDEIGVVSGAAGIGGGVVNEGLFADFQWVAGTSSSLPQKNRILVR